MTFEDFKASVGDMPINELRDLVERETGERPRGRLMDDVLQSAYELYTAHVARAAANPAGAVELPPEPDETPEPVHEAPPEMPDPPAPDMAPQPPEAPEPVPEPVEYEGRSRTGRAFHKGGRVFSTRWDPMGKLSAAEVEYFQKWRQFVTIRVRG